MTICLPKFARDNLLKALKEQDISVSKLYDMNDAERNIIFSQYVGKDLASFVNSRFEQAMLSNQKKSLANWIERTTSHKDPIRRELIKKVNRIEKLLTPDEQKGKAFCEMCKRKLTHQKIIGLKCRKIKNQKAFLRSKLLFQLRCVNPQI